ncbi:MAG TPA: hypothetical protein PK022_06415, partial [Syntrophales bacterium]|nr:hypothetical protein [Syntrophales bacterium]
SKKSSLGLLLGDIFYEATLPLSDHSSVTFYYEAIGGCETGKFLILQLKPDNTEGLGYLLELRKNQIYCLLSAFRSIKGGSALEGYPPVLSAIPTTGRVFYFLIKNPGPTSGMGQQI